MVRIFYSVLIYFNNFFVYPYFSFLGSVSTFWLWIFSFGLYFVGVVGFIMWPILWYLRKKFKRILTLRNALSFSILLSAVEMLLMISQFFLFIFVMDRFYLSVSNVSSITVFVIFLTLIFLTSTPFIYFLFNFLLNHKKITFEPWLLLISALSTGLTLGLILFVVWITAPSGLCSKYDDLVVSSGYSAHSRELCYQRKNTSECPKTPEELRAFRPKDYDELQICYYPVKEINGYTLRPRLMRAKF
ncbi:MAG TPA: hypothetical protein VF209_02395 [Patescibacteria group bacterium]